MTPGIAFALGFEDGVKRAIGPGPSRRQAETFRPSLTHGWTVPGTSLYDLYLNGYMDGVRGDRWRLDRGAGA